MDAGPATTNRNDTLFAALLSGAYASAVTALLFLAVDSMRGEPLYTASLLGSVVFLGQEPSTVAPLRLDIVALYSLFHLAAFALIGLGATLLYQASAQLQSPLVLGAIVMIILSVGALVVDTWIFPGLAVAIGPVALSAGNLAAAATVTWVVRSGLRTASAPVPAEGR